MTFSQAQEIMFTLLELGSFNNLSGSQVANALRSNPRLWRSVYFTSAGIELNESGEWIFNKSRNDLISLRDLPQGVLQLDTLLILPQPEAQSAIESIAMDWKPDLLKWIGFNEAGRVMGGKRSIMEYASNPSQVLLYLWWD